MKVGILGLGLIGGSLARAYALEGHTVYAIQRSEPMLSFAMLSGAVHGRLDETTIPECDLILLAIYPGGCADWLEKNAPLVSKDALVIDCCGIKREVCSRCFPSWAGIPWQAPSFPASNTAVQTSLRAHPWCWFRRCMTISSC